MAKRYALLFSSEEYLGAVRTPYCHADRQLLAKTLTESCDYAIDDLHSIELSKDGENQTSVVMEHLMATKQRLQAGDTVLFYYAGHGISVADEPYLILPTTDLNNLEKTAVAIRDISNELRVDGVQCFRIFDSCHSGVDVRDGGNRGEPLIRGVMRRPPDGWVTIAGCDPDESCYSSKDEGHGVFTSRLAQAITEVAVGKDVRPESLKVRTCELVDEWCTASGRTQTPTLIAAVRGNISLATRRAPIKSSKPERETPPVIAAPDEVRARLLALQGDAPPGSNVYWDRYKKIRECLQEHLHANRDLLKGYADSLGEVEVKRVDYEKESLEKEVVDLLHKNGWRPLHTVEKEVEVQRDESPWGSILAISAFGGGRTRRIVHRTLSQEDSQPESVIIAKLAPDGAVPGMRLIHYLCPLQTRFLVYSKNEVTGVMNAEGNNSDAWYRLVATCDGATAKSHSDFVVAKAKEMFRTACETNVKYLESEQGQ